MDGAKRGPLEAGHGRVCVQPRGRSGRMILALPIPLYDARLNCSSTKHQAALSGIDLRKTISLPVRSLA